MAEQSQRPSFFTNVTQSDLAKKRRIERMNENLALANLPEGRLPTYAAISAGGRLGSIGRHRPEVERLNKLNEVKLAVDATGASLEKDPEEFYKITIAMLQKAGLTEEAHQVYTQMRSESMQNREMEVNEATALANMVKARNSGITGLGANNYTTAWEKGTSYEQTQDGSATPHTLRNDNPLLRAKLASGEWIPDSVFDKPHKPTPDVLITGEKAAVTAGVNLNADISKKQVESINQRAYAASAILGEVANIRNIVEDPTTTSVFGTAAQTRSTISKIGKLIGTDEASNWLDQIVRMNSNDYDQVYRSSKDLAAEMLRNLSADARVSTRLIELIEEAGPSVFLTNEGLSIVLGLAEKKANKSMDAQKELNRLRKELPVEEHIFLSAYMDDWFAKAASDKKYSLSKEDVAKIEKFHANARKYNTVMRQAMNKAPPPLDKYGNYHIDGKNYKEGTKYRGRDGNFYQLILTEDTKEWMAIPITFENK